MSYNNNNQEKTPVNWIPLRAYNGVAVDQSENSGLLRIEGHDVQGRTIKMTYGLQPEFLLTLLESFQDLDAAKDFARDCIAGRETIQGNRKAKKQVEGLMAKIAAEKAKAREAAAKSLRAAGLGEDAIKEVLAKMA